jgi:hypothetical protein
MKIVNRLRGFKSLAGEIVELYARERRYFFLPLLIIALLLILIVYFMTVSAPLAPLIYPMI